MMETDIALSGLQVNDQPFFAPRRGLTLSATGCDEVFKLAWLVSHESVYNHFIWLLSRLERCAEADPPWQWSSQHWKTRHPLTFRAWLMSPVGYEHHGMGVSSQFFLHCHLAPDHPTEDGSLTFCASDCQHQARHPPVLTVTPRRRYERGDTRAPVTDALRQARQRQFALFLTTFPSPGGLGERDRPVRGQHHP